MTIAIGVLCIFTIITLRDEYLKHLEEKEFLRLQACYRPHEEYLLAEKQTRGLDKT